MNRVKGIWISGYKSIDKLKSYVDSVGLDFKSGEVHSVSGRYSWMGRISADRPELRRISKKYIFSDLIEYSESDLRQAELLRVDLPGLSRGDTGPDFGNEYDFSFACGSCLSGAFLIPPFRICSKDLPKKRPIAYTNNNEILVAGPILDEAAALEGASEWLVNVEDARTRRPLVWKAIQPLAELPPMDSRTNGLEHETDRHDPDATCTICGRDCFGTTYDVAFEPAYHRDEFYEVCEKFIPAKLKVPDASRTYELIGPGTRPGNMHRQIAQPMIMVSQRVAQILLRHASKWVQLTPVALLGD